jgi:RNA polymerase sigma factor, sigma-70 family
MPTEAQFDAILLERLRRKDPDALAKTVREHARVLLRAAKGMGFREQDADDLVQDVFVTFLERIDDFEGRSQLRTWLFGILYRKAMERRRALASEERIDPIDDVFESRFDARGNWVNPPADLERLMQSTELGEMISGCMEKLPGAQRDIFVMREIEGLTTSEICKILTVTVTNMGVLMHRARTRLRECLEAKGWTRH